MSYIYLDQNNQPRGPVDNEQLKALADQGIIGPATPLKSDSGYIGAAGQIPGLFSERKDIPPLGTAGEWISEVVSGVSATKAAAQAKLKLNGLKTQLVDTYRLLGDAAEQAGWGGTLCEDIKKQREAVADVTAEHGRAATDAELARNTPGARAAKQALAEAKTRMVLATGVLDGLREKVGRALMDNDSAPPNIGARQRTEFLQLWGKIAECEWIIAHGKRKLASKPMFAAIGVLLLVGLVAFAIFAGLPSILKPQCLFERIKQGDWVRYDVTVIMDQSPPMRVPAKMTVLLEVLSKNDTKIRVRTTVIVVDPLGREQSPVVEEDEIERSELSRFDVFIITLIENPFVDSSNATMENFVWELSKKKETLTTPAGTFNCVVVPFTFNDSPLSAVDPETGNRTGETGAYTTTGKEWTSTNVPFLGVVKQEVEATFVTRMRTTTVTGTATLAAFGRASK